MRGKKKKKKKALTVAQDPMRASPLWLLTSSPFFLFFISTQQRFRACFCPKPFVLAAPLPGALSLTCSLTNMKSSPKCHLSVRPHLTTLCISNILHCQQPHPPTLNLFPSSAYRHLLTFLSFFLTVPLLQLDYKICEGRVFYLFNFSWILNA